MFQPQQFHGMHSGFPLAVTPPLALEPLEAELTSVHIFHTIPSAKWCAGHRVHSAKPLLNCMGLRMQPKSSFPPSSYDRRTLFPHKVLLSLEANEESPETSHIIVGYRSCNLRLQLFNQLLCPIIDKSQQ